MLEAVASVVVCPLPTSTRTSFRPHCSLRYWPHSATTRPPRQKARLFAAECGSRYATGGVTPAQQPASGAAASSPSTPASRNRRLSEAHDGLCRLGVAEIVPPVFRDVQARVPGRNASPYGLRRPRASTRTSVPSGSSGGSRRSGGPSPARVAGRAAAEVETPVRADRDRVLLVAAERQPRHDRPPGATRLPRTTSRCTDPCADT